MSQAHRPGERVDRSGQYRITGTRQERTSTKGERFPPTPRPGQRFVLVDPTKNGAGRGKR